MAITNPDFSINRTVWKVNTERIKEWLITDIWLLSLFFSPSFALPLSLIITARMKWYFLYWHGTFSSHMISHAHNYANFYILKLHHFTKPSSSQRLFFCIYFNAKHVQLIGELKYFSHYLVKSTHPVTSVLL